jgi:poly(3-hydroxyalkanoate) synthetase
MAEAQSALDFWMWPWRFGLGLASPEPPAQSPIRWITRNHVVADLPTMRLRVFETAHPRKTPVLTVAPYAVHDAGIADVAPGHSLVAALERYGIGPIAVTEWKSATPAMADLSVDSYLADLNIAVDILTGSRRRAPDLIGLCQGGWMSLLYDAALPGKVRRLVVAGAPIDTSHGSAIVEAARLVMPRMLDDMIAANRGLIGGANSLAAFRAGGGSENDACDVLQIDRPCAADILSHYAAWDRRAVDLPGRYYADVLAWLFRENRLARGEFPAFGRMTPLSRSKAPLYLLAGSHDQIAPPPQVFAAAQLVGASSKSVQAALADCGHLSLFMGARTLEREWKEIADWLQA